MYKRQLLLSTIYAPLAVALFAALDALPGPQPLAYGLSFLMAEGAALALLWAYGSRRELRLGLWGLALCPLLILVSYNGLHFDAWLIPLLIGWVLLLRAQRPGLALLLLLIAAALRHWPALLLPISLMNLPTWRGRIGGALVSIAALLLALAPQLWHYSSAHSGLRIYGQVWEMNDALFPLLAAGIGQSAARALALGVPALLALGLGLSSLRRDPALAGLLIVGTLLLLSPTFFPWYWLWLLPFILLARSPLTIVGAALAAVLPLYYLRFLLADLGQAPWFDTHLIWLEFGPIFALILLAGLAHVRRVRRPDHSGA